MLANFKTQRLNIQELSLPIKPADTEQLLNAALAILSAKVVAQLPDHFKNIDTKQEALLWYQSMLSDARMLTIKPHSTLKVIGFVFIFTDKQQVHIGYLLAEQCWRQGFAKEALSGFISWAQQHTQWQTLIASVEANNISSSALLLKLGFTTAKPLNGDNLCYQFDLNTGHT